MLTSLRTVLNRLFDADRILDLAFRVRNWIKFGPVRAQSERLARHIEEAAERQRKAHGEPIRGIRLYHPIPEEEDD